MNFDVINNYIDGLDWRINENSNMGYSLQGLNNHITSEFTSQYWLNEIYPKHIKKAHEDGDAYVHDLNSFAFYCAGWDLYDVLLRGLGGVQSKIECRPPKHLRSALGQACNFLYTLQGEASGAQAFSSFDTYLAPFVAYDKLGYAEVKQCMQEFVYNMNIPTRVGFQAPFSNLTFDLICPSHIKYNSAIVGGKPWGEYKFGDFQKEMDMINTAFCEVMTEGDGKGNIFSFPIPTYNVTKKFDWDAEVTNHVFRMASKYGIPYICNYIHSNLKPEDARSMCCRLRIDTSKIKRGGMFSSNPLTGSQGVVSINLPSAAFRNKGKKYEDFWCDVKQSMQVARESLKIKKELVEKMMEGGLYPYSRVYLENVKKRTGSYFSNHFSTIGLIGMHEACHNFLGEGIETLNGLDFAMKTLKLMRSEVERFQEEDDQLYNLESTPAEGSSYKLAKADIIRYPGIKTSGTKEAPFYTNSTQLPVDLNIDVLNALNHQEKLQEIYTGGTVMHIFLGESIPDYNVCKKFVRKLVENYTLPYITISPTFSVCPVHGFLPGKHETCPVCETGGTE